MSKLFNSITEDAKREEGRENALYDLIERNSKANRDALAALAESSAAANKLHADTLVLVVQAANNNVIIMIVQYIIVIRI
jgi:hypothetical protein